MRLKNAGIHFQQMMDDRLECVKDVATPYIDGILVGTRAVDEEDLRITHDRDLRRVLDVLKTENWWQTRKSANSLSRRWNSVDTSCEEARAD